MNQYQRENAVRLIEGYDLRINRKSRECQFLDAKQELLRNLHEQIKYIEDLRFEEYISTRREKITPPAPAGSTTNEE